MFAKANTLRQAGCGTAAEFVGAHVSAALACFS